MKILQVINRLGAGGAQNLLFSLTKILCAKGHDVTVLQLVKVSDDIISSKLEEIGVKVITLSYNGSLYSPIYIFKIAKIINLYDIVNVHLFPCFYDVAIAKLLLLSRTPIVYTEHSTHNRRMGRPFFKLLDILFYRVCYSRIIACADIVKINLDKFYPGLQNVCTINNGIDTKFFNDAKPYGKKELLGVEDNTFIITMVARFAYPKRQDVIIRALSRLPANFHAVFVGSQQNDKGLLEAKELAQSINVLDRTHFLYIRSDVPQILKTSDVVVLSSDYEGLSLSSIEAMASATPVVASNVQGLKEIIAGYGMLFPPGNDEQLANHLLELYHDRGTYNRLVNKSIEHSREFDIEIVADKYEKVYKEIVKG